jgi:regulator of CtrA degradation
MYNGVRGGGAEGPRGQTVSFGARFASSEHFDAIFKEGMGLVERTAAYLDGSGRREAKALASPLNLVYATESMRLTTRLLELASWLLIRRSLKDGEITAEEARRKRQRVKLRTLGRPSHIKHYAELPEGLRHLIEASFSLTDRIVQLDKAMDEPAADTGIEPAAAIAANPVACQLARLEAAFGR